MSTIAVSKRTQRNWWIDFSLAASALVAALSGVYFLIFPVSGYRGGRNPYYGVTLLFDRHTWDNLHTWGGVVMIAAAGIHLALHWNWFVSVTRRTLRELTGKCACTNPRSRWNLALNLVVGVSFLLTALSGVYFLLFPEGRGAADPMWLLTRLGWDLLHTWSGVVLVASAVVHFGIHWLWVKKVTLNIAGSLRKAQRVEPEAAA